jgi:hypothetical protein
MINVIIFLEIRFAVPGLMRQASAAPEKVLRLGTLARYHSG